MKKTLIILIILLILIVVALGTLKIRKKTSNINANVNNTLVVEETIKEEKVKKVDNINMFFTVKNLADKYLAYLSAKEADKVYILLDNSYIKQKGITENNVLDKLEPIEGNISFRAKKMYYMEDSPNKATYYIYGTIQKNTISSVGERKDIYLTIKMNMENDTFSVIPEVKAGVFND